jgi:hypothetical protein
MTTSKPATEAKPLNLVPPPEDKLPLHFSTAAILYGGYSQNACGDTEGVCISSVRWYYVSWIEEYYPHYRICEACLASEAYLNAVIAYELGR